MKNLNWYGPKYLEDVSETLQIPAPPQQQQQQISLTNNYIKSIIMKEYGDVWYGCLKNAVGEKSRHLGHKTIIKKYPGDIIWVLF